MCRRLGGPAWARARAEPVSSAPVHSVGDDAASDPLATAAVATRPPWGSVRRNGGLPGLTSPLPGHSPEPVSAVLPLYFMFELRMTPLQFGLLDGLYQGSSALVRVAGGLVADAGGRYKPVAMVGYGLSAFCKLGLLLVGSAWAPIASLL